MSEPRLGDGFSYEDAMEVAEEKRRGLSRRCPACSLGWADCRCDRYCAECGGSTNHTTVQHQQGQIHEHLCEQCGNHVECKPTCQREWNESIYVCATCAKDTR